MESESHDRLIEAVMEYIKWQEIFELMGSKSSGIKARNCLSMIRNESIKRRLEIQERQQELKKSRKGKPGRPRMLHNADGTFAGKKI
jgi:hypothetical protein